MLTILRIKNLALVAELTLELSPGYNVVTGETGAGKSILIGALNLVLGERADRNLMRAGSDSCMVEAVFDVSRLKAPLVSFLDENGVEPCEGGELVLKRSFTAAGVNRQFINGSPVPLHTLATVGEWLVDIHGPHDHQSLLRTGRQLELLDAFGTLEAERERFAELVRKLNGLAAEKAALVVDERAYAQQLDLLRFQAGEITAANLRPGEHEQLEQEYHRANNAARLLQLSQGALALLSENDGSVLTQAGGIGRTLQELKRIDASAANLTGRHEQAVSALQELQAELSRYAERLEVDPARLEQLEERLNLLQSLKRKYGASIAEAIEFGQEANRKLQALEQRDVEVERINGEMRKTEAALRQAGETLSAKRRKIIPQLGKAVSRQLADLGFKQSRFEVELRTVSEPETNGEHDHAAANGGSRIPQHGFDTVEFQFAPNPGEPSRPLRAIASSGELARVMLALKTVLAAEDQIPVLVFDEVDANVGGETAHAVGEKMRQIAKNRQVLCITHLPQVAAPASAHYVATKQVKGNRTISEISLLAKTERVSELARMLGGQTEAARQHAQALLE
jgi:DNA repair protein RecN (Recombination protein N)